LEAAVQAANDQIKKHGGGVAKFVSLLDLFHGHEVDPSLLRVNKTNRMHGFMEFLNIRSIHLSVGISTHMEIPT
jgi:hypothetical protein